MRADRGRENPLGLPLPPHRTCGSPASGSPVGGPVQDRCTRGTCIAVKEVRRAGSCEPLCHQSRSTSVAHRPCAYELEFVCSYLSRSSLSAMDDQRVSGLLPIHLPASLCSTPVTTLPCSYGGSDSRPPFTRAEGYPRFTTPESFCRSVSNHPMSSHVRFPFARFFSRSGVVTLGPFLVCAHRFSRLRHWLAGSPRHQAESTSSRTDRQTRLPLLPTSPSGDAVTVGFQPVERLVESVFTSSSDVLSGALAPAFRRGDTVSPQVGSPLQRAAGIARTARGRRSVPSRFTAHLGSVSPSVRVSAFTWSRERWCGASHVGDAPWP